MNKNGFQKLNNFLTDHKFLSAIVFSLLFSSVCLFKSHYYNVDNNLISLVLNRCFGNDNYCIFVSYAFSKIVLLVDYFFPYADGYLLICHFLLYVSMFWVAYIIFSNTSSIRKRSILLLTAVAALNMCGLADISNSNFTVQAGGLSAVGAISIFAGMHSKKIFPHLFMAILFISFGAMIRIESCLLILPYVCLHILVDLICSKDKSTIKRVCVFTISAFVFIAGIYLINVNARLSEQYKQGCEFNKARSDLVDYSRKDWNEVKEYLPEITENDYNSLKQHLYGDVDRQNTEYFREIAKYAVKPKAFRADTISAFFPSVVLKLFRINIWVTVFLLMAILSVFCAMMYIILRNLDFWRKVEAFCTIGGTLLIFTYFYYNGRFLMRICFTPVIMCVIVFSAILLYNSKKPSRISNLQYRIVAVIVAFTALGMTAKTIIRHNHFYLAMFAKTNADESKFEPYYGEDNLYIWNTADMNRNGYYYFAKQGKLPTESFLLHNIPQGDWIYGQLYFKEYLKRIQITNPVRALVERENTYYVGNDKECMETYLKEHINPDIKAEQIDEIDGIPIWKFEIISGAAALSD